MVSFSPDFDGFAFTAMCSTCQRATSLVLAAVLHEPRSAGLVLDLVGGDRPVEDALADVLP